MAIPTRRNIIREIKRLHARRAPLNITAVKRSHPKLIERVYAVRPFWGWKRALEDAGLDYKKINVELRDYVNCKICGRDMGGLSYHLISQHNVTPEEYREEYPSAELMCETVRAGMGQYRPRHRRTLPRWEEVWTPEYVLDKLAELHRRKLPLNLEWSNHHEQALVAQVIKYFGSWDEALRQIGLDPKQIRLAGPFQTWTADKVVACLQRRRQRGLPLNSAAIQKSDASLASAIVKYFRFHDRALRAAGISSAQIVRKKRKRTLGQDRYRSRRDVITALRERLLQGESIQARRVLNEDLPLGTAVIKYLESFAELYRYFRIHPPRESRWHRADKAAIIAEIQRREAAGESLSCKKIVHIKSGSALLNRAKALFGRWSDAVVAAGFEPFEGAKSPWPNADAAAIVAEIGRRKRARESLVAKTVSKEKWGQALVRRADKLFGSWSDAMRRANVDPNKRAKTPWAEADHAAIVAEICRRKRASESLRLIEVRKGKWARGLLHRCDVLFGSWNGALCAAGIEPIRENSPWPRADKASILAEIRRRKRARESLWYSKVKAERWGPPLLKRSKALFGSWKAALAAAGVSVNGPEPKRAAASRRKGS